MAFLDVLIQTNRKLGPIELGELASIGLAVAEARPNGAYRLRGDTGRSVADVAALGFVTSVVPHDPLTKLDRRLQSAVFSVQGVAAAATPAEATIIVSLDAADASAATELAQHGEVLQSTARRALVRTTIDKLGAIAAVPGVLAIEEESEFNTHNNVARTLIKLEPTAIDLGLDGTGEIVGVADSGIDNGLTDATLLADFQGRVVNIRASVDKSAFGVADGADLNNHGTHVCGSIAGDGANSNGTIRGMAPAAQLTVLSMGPNNTTSLSVPADMINGVFGDAYGDGARIHSNSWGSNLGLGLYSSRSDDVDEFMFNNRDILIVFSAGNSGTQGASTIGAPGTAKNCLTVGASESVRPLPITITRDPNLQDNDFNPATPQQNVPLTLNNFGLRADNPDDIATFSSRGPTADPGDIRIKPDLVAPGTLILSSRSSVSTADLGPDGQPHVGTIATLYANDADGIATHAEAVGQGLPGAPFFGTWNQNTPAAPAGSGPAAQDNYFYISGTSMATPITSGSAALLRQYLRGQRGIVSPSGALMKALLVNGTRIAAGQTAVPDNNRGFGWLDLANTLTPPPTGRQAFSDDIDLAVATGDIREFSVLLADTSAPFRVTLCWTDRNGVGLQNKLYLRVIDPNNATFDGDVAAFPNPSNNVQRVHIDTPVAGTYTIQVHGIEVLFGIPGLAPALRQDFALAVINGIGFSPKPVDIVQVVDHSGSMGVYGFMEPAKERSKQLVDVLRINDLAGVVQFDHTVGVASPLQTITGAQTQTDIKTAIGGIVAAGATSIGGGLQAGQAQIAASGDPAHPRAIVLLSDGHENTPPWVGGGIGDSPPAWYAGPDLSEALPAIPASTKIYTVSLGVASDEVLLQEIADARGGVFHQIYGLGEIGKLHEIYVHLQAITGGEEVIVSGSGNVDGVNGGQSVDNGFGGRAAGVDAWGLDDLLSPSVVLAVPQLATAAPSVDHLVPIDETVTSALFMVSWHDAARPVEMNVVTPTSQVITMATTAHVVRGGTTYQAIRVEGPKVGMWRLRVRAAGRPDRVGVLTHGYTFGVYGETPIGIVLDVKRSRVGVPNVELAARLVDGSRRVRSSRLAGQATTPSTSVADLIKKHASALGRIDPPFMPDTPKVDPNVVKLALLDNRLVTQRQASVFRRRRVAVRFGSSAAFVSVRGLTLGCTGLFAGASGTTRGGNAFARAAIRSVRV